MNLSESTTCLNCETSYKGNFCHHCGQKKINEEELKVGNIVLRAVHEISDIDSKLFITVKYLFLKPGFLTEEYIKGRKDSYYSPIKLFILASLSYFLIYSLFPMDSALTLDRLKLYDFSGHLTRTTDALRMALLWNKTKFDHEFSAKVRDVYSQVKYLEVLLYAFWFFLIFRAKYKLYYHHFIFSLHFLSFFALRDVVFIPLYHIGNVFIWIFQMGSTALYATIAIHVFYKESLVKAIMKTMLFFCLFFATTVALFFLSAYIVIYFTGVTAWALAGARL